MIHNLTDKWTPCIDLYQDFKNIWNRQNSSNLRQNDTFLKFETLNLLNDLSLLSLDINQKWMQKISYGKHSKHNIGDSTFQWSAR